MTLSTIFWLYLVVSFIGVGNQSADHKQW